MSLKIYKEIEKGKKLVKAGDYVSAKNLFNNMLSKKLIPIEKKISIV